MDGTELSALVDEVSGGASIGATLKFQLLNRAKAVVEQRRPWMILRKTDTSKTVTTGNTWQTAIDLFDHHILQSVYGDDPIQLFDGNNRVERYRRVPWNLRLTYKDTPKTKRPKPSTSTARSHSPGRSASTTCATRLT